MYGIIMSTEGGDSMRKIKEALFSEKGMKAVNALFLLAALLRNSGIIFAAYIMWIVYLSAGIKRTSSKAVKVINSIFILFAALMVLVNACFLVMAL